MKTKETIKQKERFKQTLYVLFLLNLVALLSIIIFLLKERNKNQNTNTNNYVATSRSSDENFHQDDSEEETSSDLLIKNGLDDWFLIPEKLDLSLIKQQSPFVDQIYNFLFEATEVSVQGSKRITLYETMRQLQEVFIRSEVTVKDLAFLNQGVIYLVLPTTLPLEYYLFSYEKDKSKKTLKAVTEFFLELKQEENRGLLSEYCSVLKLFGYLFGWKPSTISGTVTPQITDRKVLQLIFAKYVLVVQNYTRLLRIIYGRKAAVEFVNYVWKIMRNCNERLNFKDILIESVGYEPVNIVL